MAFAKGENVGEAWPFLLARFSWCERRGYDVDEFELGRPRPGSRFGNRCFHGPDAAQKASEDIDRRRVR